jgi:hypothetical protein
MERLKGDDLKPLTHKIIRIKRRGNNIGVSCLADFRKSGCASEEFFELHPQDIIPGAGRILCSHEIASD